MNTPLLTGFVDWLGTFALHSTLVLGFVLALTAALRGRAATFQEGALRVALWAALVSSSAQYFGLGSPWPVQLASPPAAVASPDAAIETDLAVAVPSVGPPRSASWDVSWREIVAGAALASAVGGLAWLWSLRCRLRRVLARRQPEVDPRVLATAAQVARELGMQQSPHVSRCDGINTPIAFGWLRPEICLPARAVELADSSLRAMLAHEVAHLRRCDPAWMWLAAALQALFPWQLLMVLARKRWARLIELRCDAIAAAHSSPTAVARCLLDVADWLRPARRAEAPMIALGMAARASALRERIEAALRPRSVTRIGRGVSFAGRIASVSLLTFVAPGVGAPSMEPALPSHARVAADLLQAERDQLVADVERLRTEIRTQPLSRELELLLSALTRRLHVLDQLNARLQARVDHRETEPR